VRTHAEHLAHTLNPVPLFERVGHCVPVRTDDKIYKTAYTRGLDGKKHMSAYSIILDMKNTHTHTEARIKEEIANLPCVGVSLQVG